jgi:hypothetical protein
MVMAGEALESTILREVSNKEEPLVSKWTKKNKPRDESDITASYSDIPSYHITERNSYFNTAYISSPLNEVSRYEIKLTEKEDILYPQRNVVTGSVDIKIDFENQISNILKQFFDTSDNKYLYRFLVKSNIINRGCNCCIFNKIGIPDLEIDKYIKGRVPSETKRILTDIMSWGITDVSPLKKKISDIVTHLYYSNPEDMFGSSIDNSDVYLEIIESFVKRGIGIDEELLKPIDFKSLRRKGTPIDVLYMEVFNELIVLPELFRTPLVLRHGRYDLQSILKNKPVITNDVSSLKEFELVNINGVNYRKSVFESIVETDLNNFLSNLRVESLLYNSEQSKDNELL